jgi:hypothetical protein
MFLLQQDVTTIKNGVLCAVCADMYLSIAMELVFTSDLPSQET